MGEAALKSHTESKKHKSRVPLANSQLRFHSQNNPESSASDTTSDIATPKAGECSQVFKKSQCTLDDSFAMFYLQKFDGF